MKNLIKILFVLSFLLPVCAQGQAVTWSKWYDIAKADNAGEDVKQTFEGGYIILGNYYTSFNAYSFLIKTDYLGNIEWQKVIEDSVTYNDLLSCYAVHQTNDSGYTVSGYGRDSAVLLKTDKNGEVQWLKKYSASGLITKFNDHENTIDGGIIAGGRIFSLSIGKVYIVKTDSIGNLEWTSILDVFDNESINKIVESTDGSIYFTGLNRITKLNSYGSHIWSRNILKIGSDLLELSSYTILLAGSNPQMYLSKIDTSGHLLWQKSYFPGATCNSMALSLDKNIILSGSKETFGIYNSAVTKTDTSGIQIFTKTILLASDNYFFLPRYISSTSDYGFILTGITDFPGPPFLDNLFTIKTDSSCNAPELISIINNNTFTPDKFELYQNYPNPFNPKTNIQYEIFKPGNVNLSVYNINGEEIATLINSDQAIGKYIVIFNADLYKISSGLYFIKMTIKNSSNLSSEKISKIIKIIYLK